MALLERVATLVRANLNDLVDRAEDPEKMIKQVILDMENQLMQVKTQVAIAIADQHVLGRKRAENDERKAEWVRKAELALERRQEDLARGALERSLTHQQMVKGFDEQLADQKVQVENLKSALSRLEQKLLEAHSKRDLLIAQHRRARAVGKAADAQLALNGDAPAAGLKRMEDKVLLASALSGAKSELLQDDMNGRLAAMEREDQIDRMLAEIKSRKGIEQ